MKKSKNWMFLLLIIGIGGLTSCEKEETIDPKKEVTTDTQYRAAGWPSIKIKIDSGTRKQADQEQPNTTKDLGECHGRSFCFQSAYNGDVTAGGVELLTEDFSPSYGTYAFTLTKTEGVYKFSVSPEDISPETSATVFAEHVFEMDADYIFPEWVAAELDAEKIVLSKGTYAADQDEENNIYFYFE